MGNVDKQDDDFYAHCHEQFGLPPFADTTILIFGYGSILWKQDFEFTKAYEVYIKDYKRVFFQSSTDHRGTPEQPGRVVTLLPTSCFPAYTEADMDPEALASRSSLVREPGLEGSKHENRVYGKAYQLPSEPAKMYEILQALDVRESGGYTRVCVTLFHAHPRSTKKKSNVTGKAASEEQEKEEEEEEEEEELLVVDPVDKDQSHHHHPKKEVLCLCYIATTECENYLGDARLTDMATHMLDAAGKSGTNKEYLYNLAETLREMGAHDPHVYGLAAEARRIESERAKASSA